MPESADQLVAIRLNAGKLLKTNKTCCLTAYATNSHCITLHIEKGSVQAFSHLNICHGRKDKFIQGILTLLDYLCIYECANAVVVNLVEEIVVQMNILLNGGGPDESKLYSLVYFSLPPILTKLTEVISKQRESWTKLLSQDNTEDSFYEYLSKLQVAEDAFTASFHAYKEKEQHYFKFFMASKANKAFFRALDSDIQRLFMNTVRGVEVIDRQNTVILSDLQELLSNEFTRNGDIFLELTPFGSRISRLGGEESDLDISMSLFTINYDTGAREYVPIFIDNRYGGKASAHEKRTKFLTSDILKSIRKACRNHNSGFTCKEFIPAARIPIVRLKHQASGVEVDICIENQLGVQNTYLLREYARVDARIHSLLLAVKTWAKHRCVNQASHGTISTFSWCLMVLYYLRHGVAPALAPAFQPNAYGTELLQHLQATKGYGTEHCTNLIFELLPLPPAAPVPISQRVTAAELFCGFFAFYGIDCANSFDFSKEEINIRSNTRGVNVGDALFGLDEDDLGDDADKHNTEENSDTEVDDESGKEPQAPKKEKAVDVNAKKIENMPNDHRGECRVKIRDPFVDCDLGRCVRANSTQYFIQNELRRAFLLVFQHLSLDASVSAAPAGSSLWSSIAAPHPDLPHGFSLCTRCDMVGHMREKCPESLQIKENRRQSRAAVRAAAATATAAVVAVGGAGGVKVAVAATTTSAAATTTNPSSTVNHTPKKEKEGKLLEVSKANVKQQKPLSRMQESKPLQAQRNPSEKSAQSLSAKKDKTPGKQPSQKKDAAIAHTAERSTIVVPEKVQISSAGIAEQSKDSKKRQASDKKETSSREKSQEHRPKQKVGAVEGGRSKERERNDISKRKVEVAQSIEQPFPAIDQKCIDDLIIHLQNTHIASQSPSNIVAVDPTVKLTRKERRALMRKEGESMIAAVAQSGMMPSEAKEIDTAERASSQPAHVSRVEKKKQTVVRPARSVSATTTEVATTVAHTSTAATNTASAPKSKEVAAVDKMTRKERRALVKAERAREEKSDS